MKGNKLNSKIIVDNSDDDFSDNDSSFDHNNNENINTNDFETQCDLILKKMTNNYRQQREERSDEDKSGFTNPSIVPDKLADYVGLEHGTIMSRTELTALICDEFKKKGLFLESDKRVIIPDDEVKKLFKLSDSASKSINPKDKDGLNFYNLQKYIAECYKEPTIVPNNLADFLGLDHGTSISKTEVTALVCNKFKEKKLYLENDKKVIVPDDEVKKLFNLKDKHKLDYYQIQKNIVQCYKEVDDKKPKNNTGLNNKVTNKNKNFNVLNMAK